MGDGVIDGRGGEKMLGSQYSWWDLAEQARAGGGQQVPRLIVATDFQQLHAVSHHAEKLSQLPRRL